MRADNREVQQPVIGVHRSRPRARIEAHEHNQGGDEALKRLVIVLTLVAMVIGAVTPVTAQSPVGGQNRAGQHRADNLPGPLTARQEARRKAAQELILSGQASPDADGVVQLAEDKYFEAAVTGPAKLFTILAEFGSQSSGRYGRVPGPLHNEIPKPNREIVDGQPATFNPALPYDNFRQWTADFNAAFYEDLLFGASDSFRDFYLAQSSGAYDVTGEAGNVSGANGGWVGVPGNASLYGDNAIEYAGGAWQFIEDSGNAWYADALQQLGSAAAVEAYLSQYDVWDRYDHDGDGNFDESDGYLDHFQAVHAGEGEDAGGGAQGGDAIWSHRWYVNATDFGATGPSEDAQFGGAKIGDTNYWIGDYTVEGENGGLGVFAHEFGHDLGLPDLYDTNAGENGTAFWTLMSSGSWLGDGTEDIGTKPNYMGPWEKLQLGWLDYSVVSEGEAGDFTLAPSEAVIVDVPDEEISTTYTTPYSGTKAWWTSSADDLNTTLTLNQALDLANLRSATVTAKAWYEIEAGYDYLYAEYKTSTQDWTQIGQPLDGSSNGRWATLRYSIPGGNADTQFRFRYQTDGGVHLAGAFIDDIAIKAGRTTLFFDDVEGSPLWAAEGGFKISTGTETTIGDRYYIAENRTYVGYDSTLEVGPYQFSFALTDPDKVEHFAFEDGLLVWMVDETYTDNNNSQHTGRGLALPVDARPQPFFYTTDGTTSDGTKPSNRRQPFDATFGLQDVPAGPNDDPEPGQPNLPCDGLHKQVVVGNGPSQSIAYRCAWPTAAQRVAKPVFNDTDVNAYWDSTNPQNSTKIAGHGTRIEVTSQTTGGPIDISVDNTPAATP
jgi:immune inhibitor A